MYNSNTKQHIDIYIVNLDKDKDRMSNMKKELKGIKYNRFSAINGKLLDIDELKKNGTLKMDYNSFKYSKNNNKDTLKGSIGCALSHINLWEKLINIKKDHFIILEDDCKIPKNFLIRINRYLEDVPNNWDIIFLGGSRIYAKKISNNVLGPVYINSWMNCGLFSYIIKRSSIKKLLNYSLPINTYIDMQINKEYGNGIKAYYIYPLLVGHDYSKGSSRDEYKGKYSSDFQNDANKIVII